MAFEFNFTGHPISKDNFKSFNRYGMPFLSRKFKEYEADLRRQFVAQRPVDWKPLTKPLSVKLAFRFKNGHRADLWNLPKSLDAFNGLIWNDDRQIVKSEMEIETGEPEGTRLIVEEVE